MKHKTWKRTLSLGLTVSLLAAVAAPASAAAAEYIEAPYKASDFKTVTDQKYLEPVIYENGEGQPSIGVTTVGVLKVDGLYFKDSNNNQELDPFEDWRLPTAERVADLVSKLSLEQKAGQVMINSLSPAVASGKSPDGGAGALIGGLPADTKDAFVSGIIPTGDDETSAGLNILVNNQMRHTIIRNNPSPAELALYINALQQTSEYLAVTGEDMVYLPVIQASNQRNHSGATAVGFSEASGIFATYPGTLGLTAAAMGMEAIEPGSGYEMISTFADESRQEWAASGIRKGYIYMADVTSDPRWTRTFETWGERTDVVTEIISRLVTGFQNGSDGVNEGSVAMTVKHFPGGGARENGNDPHSESGRWNIYAEENTLAKYHLPSFQAAVDAGVSSIMPYYAVAAGDDRTATQQLDNGYTMKFTDQVGMAYSPEILQTLLRDTMGFKGYVNSDTGINEGMAWGIDKALYDMPARIAMAINAGTDMISGTTDLASVLTAVERAEVKAKGQSAIDAYCKENDIPAEKKEALFADKAVLSMDRLDEAASRLLGEAFDLGLFENAYADPDEAESVVSAIKATGHDYDVQQKSAVLLKNAGSALPAAAGKTVYVSYLDDKGDESTAALQAEMAKLYADAGYTVTEDPAKADYAFFYINPVRYSGWGLNGYLPDLRLGEDLDTPTVNSETTGYLDGKTMKLTTVAGFNGVKTAADAVHANGGKAVALVNMNQPWILDNLEPNCDAVIAHFDTLPAALLDVVSGKVAPVGKLPVSVPANAEVLKLENQKMKNFAGEEVEYAICASPNDVPGYDKDQYIAADVLATTSGNSYTYKDSEGNYYGSGFGLTYNTVATATDATGATFYRLRDVAFAVKGTAQQFNVEWNNGVVITTNAAYTAAALAPAAAATGAAETLALTVDGAAATTSAVLINGNYYVSAEFLATLGVTDAVAG